MLYYSFKLTQCLCLVYLISINFPLIALPVETGTKDWNSSFQTLFSLHPEILGIEEEKKEKSSEAEHRDTYPDPKIGFAYRSYPYRGNVNIDRASPDTPSMTGNEISISQEIPFPGKLDLEKNLGKLDAVSTEHLIDWKKNRFLRTFLEIKFSIDALNQEIADLEKISKVYSSLVKIQNSSYTIGKGELSGTLLSFNGMSRVKDRVFQKNISLKEAEASLHYFIGENETQLKGLFKDSEIKQYLKGKETELESGLNLSLVDSSPEVESLQVGVRKVEMEEKKNNILHFPDSEIFFSYMQRRRKPFLLDRGPLNYAIQDNPEFNGDLFSFGVTMRIPVWSYLDKGDLTSANRHKKNRAILYKESRKRELETELKTLWESWKGNRERYNQYEAILLPAFRKNFASSQGTYGKGEGNLSASLALQIETLEAEAAKHEFNLNRWKSLLRILEITNNLLPSKGAENNG